MKRQRVWIIEANYAESRRSWHPTVGIGLTKRQAEQEAWDWRRRNPGDTFRVRPYFAARP